MIQFTRICWSFGQESIRFDSLNMRETSDSSHSNLDKQNKVNANNYNSTANNVSVQLASHCLNWDMNHWSDKVIAISTTLGPNCCDTAVFTNVANISQILNPTNCKKCREKTMQEKHFHCDHSSFNCNLEAPKKGRGGIPEGCSFLRNNRALRVIIANKPVSSKRFSI